MLNQIGGMETTRRVPCLLIAVKEFSTRRAPFEVMVAPRRCHERGDIPLIHEATQPATRNTVHHSEQRGSQAFQRLVAGRLVVIRADETTT